MSLALALGAFFGTAVAQTVGAEDEPTPEVAPAADEMPSTVPPGRSLALRQCTLDRNSLAEVAVRLRGQLDVALQVCEAQVDATRREISDQLDICEEDLAQGLRTNITLNDRLLACQARPEHDPTLLEALASAEAEIAALKARLDELGFSAEAGFSYAGGGAWGSFATTADLPRLLRGLPRLAEVDCGAALDWLDGQEGPSLPLRRVVWVWRSDLPLLCARDRTGGLALIEPSANDEAHAIVFQ